MKDNFIEEIKEEVRNDQMMAIWREYGNIIIGVVVAILLATAGYVFWHGQQEKKLKNYTLQFEAAVKDADLDALNTLQDGSTKGYEMLSGFTKASLEPNLDASLKDLDEIASAAKFGSFYRQAAELQRIMKKFDITNGAEILDDLKPLIETTSVIQSAAFELKGFAHMKLGQKKQAIESFIAVSEHPNATQSMRMRAAAMVEQLG